MANEGAEELDLGEEKGGKKKLIIIIAVAVVLLLGGGGAAYFFLMGDDEAVEEEAAGEEAKPAEEAAKTEEEQGPVQYADLDPVFVVNMPGRPKLLQVGVSVRFRSEALAEFLKHNDPMIRHNMLNLLSAKDGKMLKSREAKDALQQEMLDELNRILKDLDAPGSVEALYFTSFVMQ